jgi:hypothetical protein
MKPATPAGHMPVETLETARPEILYKYFPSERIDILENMELRFSRPSEFNDTFDTHYLVPNSQGPKGKSDRLRLRNRAGIFCLTERPDNHLMWVHYAKNHTGFVLGFSARAPFFQEDSRVLRKVAYQSVPRVFSEADMNACFYKSDTWTYEQEWRCVRPFQTSESRFVGIDSNLITQIIFGFRMEAWQISRIVQYTNILEMTHTQFLLSSPSRNNWTFENSPKRMAVCDNCSGNGYLMEDESQTP